MASGWGAAAYPPAQEQDYSSSEETSEEENEGVGATSLFTPAANPNAVANTFGGFGSGFGMSTEQQMYNNATMAQRISYQSLSGEEEDTSSGEEEQERQEELQQEEQKQEQKQEIHAKNVVAKKPTTKKKTNKTKRTTSGNKVEEFQVVKPVWVNDEWAPICSFCGVTFSLLTRRHHCRGCGKIFCHSCCNHWLLPPESFHYKQIQRTCLDCYKRLSIIDYDTEFDAFGDPNDHAIILLHGPTANRKYWQPQIDALKKNYYILVPDLPGHAARADEKLTMESAVKIVRNLITGHAKDRKALLFGFSLGGYIAMTFCGIYPELCAGIIVSGACADMGTNNRTMNLRGMLYKSLPNKVKASLIKNSTKIPPNRTEVSEKLLHACLRSGSFYDSWEDVQETLTGTDYIKYLKNYSGPVLFLNGEKDTRDAEVLWLAASVDVKLEIIEGANHLFLMDTRFYPTANKLVYEFADEIDWKQKYTGEVRLDAAEELAAPEAAQVPVTVTKTKKAEKPKPVVQKNTATSSVKNAGASAERVRQQREANKQKAAASKKKKKPRRRPYKKKVDVLGANQEGGLWDSIIVMTDEEKAAQAAKEAAAKKSSAVFDFNAPAPEKKEKKVEPGTEVKPTPKQEPVAKAPAQVQAPAVKTIVQPQTPVKPPVATPSEQESSEEEDSSGEEVVYEPYAHPQVTQHPEEGEYSSEEESSEEESEEETGGYPNIAQGYGMPQYNAQTAYGQPSYGQTGYNQPTYNQPSYNQSTYNQPTFNPSLHRSFAVAGTVDTPAQAAVSSSESDSYEDTTSYQAPAGQYTNKFSVATGFGT
eukprot:TRINITY_DN44_c0_g1_i1.p1 TRINITY_DN44_c0_g1~~TRINITY_DN44_c0_g1_i1.p1  ORF type:complete len:830 (+),score=198.05 TRINITY_DN44_c0_g1_i1:44-2491(+)